MSTITINVNNNYKVGNVINLPITFLGDAFISGPTTTKSMCVLSIALSIFFFTLQIEFISSVVVMLILD